MSVLDDSAFSSLIPCRVSKAIPRSRATSNSVCNTRTYLPLQTSAAHTITVKDVIYQIPCFLIKHEQELRELATIMSVRNAVKALAAKYGVSLTPPVKPVTRYRYSQAQSYAVPAGVEYPSTFKMGPIYAGSIPSIEPYLPTVSASVRVADCREIRVMNDDAKTYSDNVTDMNEKSTFWSSIFPTLTSGKSYVAVVNSSSSKTTAHTGLLFTAVVSGKLKVLFLPVIIKEFLFLYRTYQENTSFNFLHIGSSFVTPSEIMNTLYFQLKVPCRFL